MKVAPSEVNEECATKNFYVDLDKIMMLMEVEMQMIDPGDDVIIVGAKNSL